MSNRPTQIVPLRDLPILGLMNVRRVLTVGDCVTVRHLEGDLELPVVQAGFGDNARVSISDIDRAIVNGLGKHGGVSLKGITSSGSAAKEPRPSWRIWIMRIIGMKRT